MSGLLASQHVPAAFVAFPLSAIGAWQNLCEGWGNTLRSRKEITVAQATQGTVAPHLLRALKQNSTNLLGHEAVIVKHRARQVLTALRTLDDRLQLVSWWVNADGSLLHTGNSPVQMAAIQQVRLVRARNYVVACRTKTGEMHLSRWDVSNTGAIYLAGERTHAAQSVQWLEMAALDAEHIVTLALTDGGVWQLALWQLQDDDAFRLLYTEKILASPVSECKVGVLLKADGSLRLLTVFAETLAALSVHVWHYQPGEALTFVASQRVQPPDAAAIITTAISGDQLMTVVQTLHGELRLALWQWAADGTAPFCQADHLLHEQVGYCTCQKYNDGFVLFYRTLAGELQIQHWQQQPDGVIGLVAAGQAPTTIGEVTGCDARLEGNAPLLTATIGMQGAVTLTTWQ